MTARGLLGIAALLLLGVACSDRPSFCTLVGCGDHLAVVFSGSAPEVFTVEITGPGLDPVTFDVDCSEDRCTEGPMVFLEERTPSEVTVTASWEGHSVSETFRPRYHKVQPNGPGCDPSNVIIAPGEVATADMLRDTSEGLLVDHVMGLGQSNIMNGDFSVNVSLGYKM